MHYAHRAAAALAAAALFLTAVAVPAATAAPPAARQVVGGTGLAADESAADESKGEQVKYYVMKSSPDGEPEFLFQIAQRYLGDGNRYTEIFELNKGRVQPDGGTLTDPAAVLPGWVMQLPDDAEGEGIEVGVLPAGPAGGGSSADPSSDGSAAPSVPYYVVGKTRKGETEYLYLIAERFLGDGERAREIFKLNKGRVQPDGGVLTDRDQIEVGWVLQLPEDAKGKAVQHGPLPGPTAEPSASASSTAAGAAAGAQAAASPSWVVLVLIGLGVLALVGAVGFGVVLVARRLRGREEPFDDSLLRTDTSASWMVDRALRVLLASCEREGIEVPGVTGVFIEGGAMRLRLASPASPAPDPWVANDDGQSWTAPLARLQSAPASEASTAQFARLVTLGMAETGRVLVDFVRARGVISLDGPTRARHEVLRRWLGELTGNPWSNDPRVVMVGNGLPQAEQAEYLSAIEQVIPELGVGDGGVLVLSQAPSVTQQDLLAARFADPRFTWVVIVLGESSSAKWRIRAGDDGWLRSGFLPDVRYTEQTAVRRAGE
ncbi:LysM peptidoglycan-binding domain-containing protein [Promicromonospora sp. NPDC060271]|uniref:LysM peptidoglycan-binding domain-containing protein n=1 Tax=Promicromonospora sp. NPDC060271 TaxID=3347089 RepID=UPI00364D8FDB